MKEIASYIEDDAIGKGINKALNVAFSGRVVMRISVVEL